MGDGSKKHVCVFTTLHTLPFQVFDSIGYNIAHRTLRCIVRLLRLDSIEIKLCISHFETTNGARGAGVTLDTWRRFVEPWAEWITSKLYESTIPARRGFARNIIRVATRLTQRRRREVKGSEVPAVNLPATDHLCEVCGAKIRRRNSK